MILTVFTPSTLSKALACSFVCVRFTLPSPHPIDSVKGHATLSLLACRFVSPFSYLDLFRTVAFSAYNHSK
ncbi:hypothetical protein TNCV_3735351 [Trichonephila clavipes]|nr:hypothetical protein TNCV_3735351 [Trichonephila clavipes]